MISMNKFDSIQMTSVARREALAEMQHADAIIAAWASFAGKVAALFSSTGNVGHPTAA